MRFSKFEALGNDFLIVAEEDAPASISRGELARRMCERNRGAGADGLLIAGKPVSADAQVSMQIWNADGSEAEMSGNGLRCLAAFEWLRAGRNAEAWVVETRAGIRSLQLVGRSGPEMLFRADMGAPILQSKEIPLSLDPPKDPCVDLPVAVCGLSLRATMVSMGNPHCAVFVGDFESIDWRRVGRELERHPLFPSRTNVEFIRVIDRHHLEVKLWERGVGETSSSGTSSCAAAVSSVLNGLAERAVSVLTPGGTLLVEWRSDNRVMLEGPARFVFEGEWPDQPAAGA